MCVCMFMECVCSCMCVGVYVCVCVCRSVCTSVYTHTHHVVGCLQVRRRSKACRAGLKEEDELVAIDECVCAEFSHAQAMSLIDSHRTSLNLRVKR